ncbi:MAG: Ldh family oxidoreductase [Granulosicoccus sp.]
MGESDSTKSDSTTISVSTLRSFIEQALCTLDVPEHSATKVASLMVDADILGHDTHGIFRLRQYLARLRDGGCNPDAHITVVKETAATALIDGDNGLGHLAMSHACELAIAKARDAGIGWVGVRNGNHAGPLALYVRPQAQQGMIGMAAAVGSANHVPPFGGTDLLLGTNPVAISAPTADDDPFVLDMASTVAAMGKIKALAQRGESMPEGWMVGRDGQPLTDPSRRSEGYMLPIGGPKGFGLSVAMGLMAGVLNGAAFGSDVVDFTSDTSSPTNTGQFVLALNVEAFGDLAQFTQSTSAAFAQMRASQALPGHDPVRLPGDGKNQSMSQRLQQGVKLGTALCRDLQALADEHGIHSPFKQSVES